MLPEQRYTHGLAVLSFQVCTRCAYLRSWGSVSQPAGSMGNFGTTPRISNNLKYLTSATQDSITQVGIRSDDHIVTLLVNGKTNEYPRIYFVRVTSALPIPGTSVDLFCCFMPSCQATTLYFPSGTFSIL